MAGDWAQRVRQLGGTPDAREATDRNLSHSANPFAPNTSSPTSGPTYPSAATPSGAGVYDPFGAAAAATPQPSLEPADPHTTPGVQRPTEVKVASWALLAAALLTLTMGGLSAYAVTELRTSVGHVLALDQSGVATVLASGYADDTETVLMVIALAAAAVMAVAYLIVCKAVWSGRSWPRTVSPFLVVLSLPAVLIGPLAATVVLAGAVATAAAWMPRARAYARQQIEFRATSRRR